jgi:hypothetical protein
VISASLSPGSEEARRGFLRRLFGRDKSIDPLLYNRLSYVEYRGFIACYT